MLWSKILVGFASMLACVDGSYQSFQGLGNCLTKSPKAYQLLQVNPEISRDPDAITQLQWRDDRGTLGLCLYSNPVFSTFKNLESRTQNTTVPLLQYHILQGTINAGDLKADPAYVKPTLLSDPTWSNVTNGQNILITKQPDVVVFSTRLGSRATVVNNDIEFQGGLIQIVDSVLVPPSGIGQVLTASQVQSFLGGLHDSKIMPALDGVKDITVFAPRDQAMEAIGGTLAKMDLS